MKYIFVVLAILLLGSLAFGADQAATAAEKAPVKKVKHLKHHKKAKKHKKEAPAPETSSVPAK